MAHGTRTFRIFVSSTFADLKVERNALQRIVFPKLRALCEQNRCRFQAVDLRWGVSEEAGLDQRTMKICLDEIERCRKTSPRPNFIVLLGDRYGWRPLPYEIPADEFKQIKGRVPDPADADRLKTWYPPDDNARDPVVHYLRPRGNDFRDENAWNPVERDLRRILHEATKDMPLDDDHRLKYIASATEQEIHAGALKAEEPQKHVFCFFRTIRPQPPEGDAAKDFVEGDEWGRNRLNELKTRLKKKLPENFFDYKAAWQGDRPRYAHLRQLCRDVQSSLWRVIKAEIGELKPGDDLKKENEAHAAFGGERAMFFTGREGILRAIEEHVGGPDRRPLAVTGEGGTGKTALMAHAANLAEDKFRGTGMQVIRRFIGTTPTSSDGRALLDNICREVSQIYGAEGATTPADFQELSQEFAKRLGMATAKQPLVLFLDALDQLPASDPARRLAWLPTEHLPEHVRVVVSCLPGDCQAALERRLPPANRLKLEPMPREKGGELLDRWLSKAKRKLTPAQREEVLEKFAGSGLPLYLKLAFEEARRWRSEEARASLKPDIPEIIQQMFERLSKEANHGEMMVSRSLGYLGAAKNGLTEDELLDVLSEDKEVMDDFRRRSPKSPEVNRLPVVVWSRLYFDLEPYLSERSADGASLLTFYHRQLADAVAKKFLVGPLEPERHRALAAYFGPKPMADLRRLSEVPYQQTLGELWDKLYETLSDLEFIEAKITHVGLVEHADAKGNTVKVHNGAFVLQEDYRLALERFPCGESAEVAAPGAEGRAPLVLTAWKHPGDGSLAFGCPWCTRWSPVDASKLGTELACSNPKCGGPVRLNPFTIDGDWRPVAEAWHARK